jgi:hypothetical protein
MDPVRNPYAPGAGSPPPALAGRDAIREKVDICLRRRQLGRSAKSVLLIGLRGVGKTVLLDKMRLDAEQAGFQTVRIEAPEDRSLPALLAPQLRLALLRLNRIEAAREAAVRALRALAGFAGKLKLTYKDLEVGLDYEPEPGLADNGDLEMDLTTLFEEMGRAALAADTTLAIFVDELQYVPEAQLGALISALHRCSQLSLPVAFVGAGLPQLRGQIGDAKTYAERLFDIEEIGPLSREDAEQALLLPAQDEEVEIEPAAIAQILDETHGYPYFLQEWGKTAWDVAENDIITAEDVAQASHLAVAALDESFFRIRFDRLKQAEKIYLRAMAELGPGPHRSGDIATQMKRRIESLAPVRNALIGKGMIWSPAYGETAFTVPLFDAFMKRIMPAMSDVES